MADNFNLDDILDEYSDKAKSVNPLSDADVDALIGAGIKEEEKADKTERKSLIDDSIFDEVIDDGRPKEAIKTETKNNSIIGGIEDIDVDLLVDEAVSNVEDTPVLQDEEPTLVKDDKSDSIDDFTLPEIEVDDNAPDLKYSDIKNNKKSFAQILSQKHEMEKAEEEEAEKEGLEAGLGSRFRLRKTSGNTAIIEGLLKLKRERDQSAEILLFLLLSF